MRIPYVCVCVCIRTCVYMFARAVWAQPRNRSAIQTSLHNGPRDTGSQTLNSPETNLRLSNEERRGCVITLWNQGQVWKTKTGRRPQPRRSHDAGGCRDYATAPQGICRGLRRWPPPHPVTTNVFGIPAREPGHPLLLVTTVSSIQTLSLLEAWRKTITAFHFQHSLRRGVSFCPWGGGPWVWGNTDTRHAGQQ